MDPFKEEDGAAHPYLSSFNLSGTLHWWWDSKDHITVWRHVVLHLQAISETCLTIHCSVDVAHIRATPVEIHILPIPLLPSKTKKKNMGEKVGETGTGGKHKNKVRGRRNEQSGSQRQGTEERQVGGNALFGQPDNLLSPEHIYRCPLTPSRCSLWRQSQWWWWSCRFLIISCEGVLPAHISAGLDMHTHGHPSATPCTSKQSHRKYNYFSLGTDHIFMLQRIIGPIAQQIATVMTHPSNVVCSLLIRPRCITRCWIFFFKLPCLPCGGHEGTMSLQFYLSGCGVLWVKSSPNVYMWHSLVKPAQITTYIELVGHGLEINRGCWDPLHIRHVAMGQTGRTKNKTRRQLQLCYIAINRI